MNILIIRFRQIGDSVLGLGLITTLRRTFPQAQIHYVLNQGIAPVYEHHPDIDRVITFSREENASLRAYFNKVREVVSRTHYDVIIDMRSTTRTLLFSLFSLGSKYRIGRKKWYATGILNHQIDTYNPRMQASMLERNLWLAEPFEKDTTVQYTDEFRLYVTPEELSAYRQYMQEQGIDFGRPVMLVNVTTKLEHKCYPEQKMVQILEQILQNYPQWQMVFNYAPGQEEENARRIYHLLNCPQQVKIDLQARSLRELMCLCKLSTLYFGNEGGARHIAQAMETPSLALFSPSAQMSKWLPRNDVPAEGLEWLEPEDVYNHLTKYL